MSNLIKNLIKYFSKTKKTYTIHNCKTSKTIISSTEHMTFSTQTNEKIDLVKKNVEEITKKCNKDTAKILEYINNANTKVFFINNADKLLKIIGEEEGIIFELKGIKALYLNFITNSKLKLKTDTVFVFKNKNVNLILLLYGFYLWYANRMDLPGFEYNALRRLKKYMKNNTGDIETLPINDIIELQETIARDKEATEFALNIARETDGAKNVKQKITEGGADI